MQYLRYREEAIRNALVLVEYLGEEDVLELLRIIKKISDVSNNINETADQ